MKQIIICIALFVLFVPLNNRVMAESACPEEASYYDGKCYKTYTHRIHPKLETYNFRAEWRNSDFDYELERITVSQSDKVVQYLKCNECMSPGLMLEFKDMNFDGYEDVITIVNTGASNAFYMVWLFDKKSKKFVPKEEFQELCGPEPDPDTKTIHTHMTGGMAGLLYTDKIYHYKNGDLVLQQQIDQGEIISDYFFRETKHFENGKQVRVETEIYNYEDYGVFTSHEAQLVCGPYSNPLTCRPAEKVIYFTEYEEMGKPDMMVEHYSNKVMWNNKSKTRQELLKMHSDYLASIRDYNIEIEDISVSMNPDSTKAIVECDIEGNYKDSAGANKHFKLRKRFRLVKKQEDWKIECEEVSKYLDGTKGRVYNSCSLE